ncbi:MAG: tetratricopeptide repeat protein [Bryobacteraceae bacterium]
MGDPSAIRAELARISQSRALGQSIRLLEFLRFTIEEALAGRGAELKEYIVGVEVYGRNANYNPKVDSIVRTEAARLRTKLGEYYAAEGKDNPIRIVYPKGGYAPSVEARPEPAASEILTVAILPFVNTSGSAEDEYFSDGLTDELIAAVGRIRNLRVIARTSVFQFKGKAVDVREIGQRLGAGWIVEGTVRHFQSRWRVTAQLVDPKSGCHSWSETYERDLQDVFAVQDEITRAIAASLTRELSGERAPARPVDPEAHRLYLMGRYCFHKWTVDEVNRSFDWLDKAVARDPAYALAWTGIANSHCILATWGVAPMEHIPAAERALLKSLHLDPSSQETQTIYASYVSGFQWQWSEGERLFQPLLESGYSPAFPIYVYTNLHPTGRLAESEQWIRKYLEIDPLNLGAHIHLGRVLYLAGRIAEGIEQLEATLRLDPSFREAHWQLALAHEAAGDYDKAMAEFGRAMALSGDSPSVWGSLGHCEAKRGRLQEAHRYRSLLEGVADKSVAAAGLALVHTGLGDRDQALHCIEQCLAMKSPLMMRIKADPRFGPLRAEERFGQVLRAAGLQAT